MKIQDQLKPALISYWMRKALRTFYPNTRYFPSENAPNTWRDLKGADLACLPVFSGGCDHTIYISPAYNWAFRAWHDSIHISKGLGFSYLDELAVAKEHLCQLELIRAPEHVKRAVWYDVAGQVEYYYKNGCFVVNQKAFVQDCLAYGLEYAIEKGYDTATTTN